MQTVNIELQPILSGVLQFVSYMVLAVFAENVVLARALGVSRLIKLVPDHRTQVWDFCLAAAARHDPVRTAGLGRTQPVFPMAARLSAGLAADPALRPVVLPDLRRGGHGCHMAAAGAAAPPPAPTAAAASSVWPPAAPQCWAPCSSVPTRTIRSCSASPFPFGSGLGYVFAVYIVREGRRRLRSKAVPSIFQGLPSSMIYIGVLSLAIYALVGHTVVL